MLGNIVLLAVLLFAMYLAATGRLAAVWQAIRGG